MKKILFTTFLMSLWSTQILGQESYIGVDSVSGKVFFAKQTELKRPIASLTMVATAKLVLDWASITNTSLNTRIRIPDEAEKLSGANPLKLKAGCSLSIRDALYATLLGSDSRAAHSLAAYVGYSLNQKRGRSSDAIESFVKELNQLTKKLRMQNTRFTNVHGLENSSKISQSTATDMAILAMDAIQNEALTFMIKQKSRKVKVTHPNGAQSSILLKNTNILLGKNGVVGLKTGIGKSAGQCIITISNKKPILNTTSSGIKTLRNRQMIVVLLGSNDCFNKAARILEFSWRSYEKWGKDGFKAPTFGKGLLRLPKASARVNTPVSNAD